MTDTTQPTTQDVERRTELAKAASVEIGKELGGVTYNTIAELGKQAEWLSKGGVAVPPHCQGKPGVCYALLMQAMEWGMPPMSVINKSYVVENKGVARIAYESQLIHAVVEKNAPITSRLRYEILGEGDDRRCKVWATFRGEKEPHVYTSEPLKKLHPGHNEKGYVRGSPLWDTLPEVQMFYHTSRIWARLFCPDVILGGYTREELEGSVVDVTPPADGLADRLKANRLQYADRGFDPDHVAREASARSSIIEGDLVEEASNAETQTTGEPATGVGGEQPGAADPADGTDDKGGGGKPVDATGNPVPGDDGVNADKKPKSRKAK